MIDIKIILISNVELILQTQNCTPALFSSLTMINCFTVFQFCGLADNHNEIHETVSFKKLQTIYVHDKTMTRSFVHKLYFVFLPVMNWFAAIQFYDIACVDNPATFFFN